MTDFNSKPPRKPLLMGILNVTPDSFSDGGSYGCVQDAIDAGLRMVEEGADIVDVGGESTRPGSQPVPLDIEKQRVLPVIEGLAGQSVRISIDTYKAAVAREALQAGAQIVNDVTALRDPEMPGVCAEVECTVCLMHMQGTPQTMQQNPSYGDVVEEVKQFLLERAAFAKTQGIPKERIWIDPGIGFGKNDTHNLTVIRDLRVLTETGYPVLIGISRKGFIGRLLGSRESPAPAKDRLEGTLALQIYAQLAGAAILRTHDVRAARRAATVIESLSL
ncbi:MAG TPA: dihydropteroate synthase [Fimbriimonas sp.]|nr:dihydropteroate synthase [Fimbriimonas sp.]